MLARLADFERRDRRAAVLRTRADATAFLDAATAAAGRPDPVSIVAMSERREREILQSIETAIRNWNIVMEKNGAPPEAASVLSCLSERRKASLERLDDIVSRRPFPAEL